MAATTPDHADAQQVLALATPALYRKNLFRVLGIPVTATPQDVRRRQKRLDMARKLGAGHTPVDGSGLLALRDPGEEDIRVALERLNDPKSRLLDEIFWFWPIASDGSNDPGLAALEVRDVQGASDAWAAGPGDAVQQATKAHNRAVLNHLIALDLDVWIAAGSNPKAGAHYQNPGLKAQALWGAALTGWRAVLDSEAFWQGVKRRGDELNDPQLTTGAVRRIREALPNALLNINAQIALGAAERGDEKLAQTHAGLLRQGAAAPGAAEEALRAALAPIRHRIESLCAQATKKAADDAEHGNQAATDLLEQTKPLLRIIDLLLEEQDVSRSGTHDAVAEATMKCLVAFGNKTEDWPEVVRLLDVAIPVATGEAQRAHMVENRKQAERNRESDCCFFCGKKKPDPAKAVEVKMFGDVKRTPNYYLNTVEVTWRHGAIKVPRCRSCASVHTRRDRVVGWGIFTAATVAFVYRIAIGEEIGSGLLQATFIAAIAGPPLAWLLQFFLFPLRGLNNHRL